MTFSTIAVLAAWMSFMADKFRSNVQRTTQILREKLWRAFFTSPRAKRGEVKKRSASPRVIAGLDGDIVTPLRQNDVDGVALFSTTTSSI
jgi:hypothetical protein